MSSGQNRLSDCTTESDERLLGVGLTSAEAELGLCEDVVCVPNIWSQPYELEVREPAVKGKDHFDGLRFASVVLLPNGLFEFAHNLHDQHGAELAIIVPMPDERGRVQNLVACDLGFKRVARWRSTLPILGMHRLSQARIEPLQVHCNVLSWLRAGREGIVILDFTGAATILCGSEPLAVDDVAFGRELSTMLRIGPPKIVARAEWRAA